MPTLSRDQLTRLTLDDISQGTSPLLVEPFQLLRLAPGRSHEHKECELLKRLPKKLGAYYLIFRLDALWANGGMQGVALDKDTEFSVPLLQLTPVAFDLFGAVSAAAFLREIVPVAVQAAGEIDVLVQRDAPDEEFDPIWARLDSYDSYYDETFSEVYSAILADIHQHPHGWQPNEA